VLLVAYSSLNIFLIILTCIRIMRISTFERMDVSLVYKKSNINNYIYNLIIIKYKQEVQGLGSQLTCQPISWCSTLIIRLPRPNYQRGRLLFLLRIFLLLLIIIIIIIITSSSQTVRSFVLIFYTYISWVNRMKMV
jgi:hypothetical protein